MKKLGVIGPGLIWHKAHKPVLQTMTDTFQVTAFAARKEQTRADAQKDFPNAECFTTYEELTAISDVDAVVVLTPILLNAPAAEHALRAGKDVIMEKPFAASLEQAHSLMQAEQASSGKVYILEQLTYSPAIQAIKEVIADGSIGRAMQFIQVNHSSIDSGDKDATGGYGSTDWRIDTQFPLGNLFDGGIHDLAFLQMLFGVPQHITARGVSVRPSFGEFDTVNTTLEYASGMQGIFAHSGCLPPQDNHLSIYGSTGMIHLQDDHLRIHTQTGDMDIPMDAASNTQRMWQDIAACIQAGNPIPYTTMVSKNDLLTLFAIEKSIHTNTTVPLSTLTT